jgi:hypothetical protein
MCGLAAVVALVGPLAPSAVAACTFTGCDTAFTGSREELVATERVAGIEQEMTTLLAQPFRLRLIVRTDGIPPGVRSTVVTRDGITRVVTIPAGKPHADQPPARVTYLDASHRCTRSIATTGKGAWSLLRSPNAAEVAADRQAQWRCTKRGANDLDANAIAAGLRPSTQISQAPADSWFVDYTVEPGFRPADGLSLGLYWPGQWRAYTRDGAGGLVLSYFTVDALAAAGQARNFAETTAQLQPGGVPVLPRLTGLPGFRRG